MKNRQKKSLFLMILNAKLVERGVSHWIIYWRLLLAV